ncbi:hypothetical protein TNCV_219561 [Trichonephila clavipes]|nr:hypothetical protein TNCV_219561 [Trichonephila clavipes]
MRDNFLTRHAPIREHPFSALPRPQKSERPRTLQQRLTRPISCLLHASMTELTVVPHLYSGYGMEARFASHMPRILTVVTVIYVRQK